MEKVYCPPLPTISFVAGSTQPLTWKCFDFDTKEPFNVSSCTAQFSLVPYSNLEGSAVLVKNMTIDASGVSVSVQLNSAETLTLSQGKYVYQITIRDNSSNTEIPFHGHMYVQRNLNGGTVFDTPTSGGDMQTTQLNTPDITVSSTGMITASVSQSAGYSSGGTRSATHSLSSADDADFVASNIKSGVTIFGTTGTYTGSGGGSSQEAPTISVSSSGLITATAGTASSSQQLATQAGKTVTPSTSTQTAVAANRYTTGAVNVAGDANLVAGNIKSGVTIFGTTGTYEGSGSGSNSVVCKRYYQVSHATGSDYGLSISFTRTDSESGTCVAGVLFSKDQVDARSRCTTVGKYAVVGISFAQNWGSGMLNYLTRVDTTTTAVSWGSTSYSNPSPTITSSTITFTLDSAYQADYFFAGDYELFLVFA